MTPSLEKQAHQWCTRNTSRQRPHRQFPPILLFPGPCVHPHHQPDDVCARPDVEDLEECIPPAIPRRHPQQIQITRSEDKNVEQLGEKGDAFGGFIAVDGPDEDAFGRRMGEVSDNAEDVEGDTHRCWSVRELS